VSAPIRERYDLLAFGETMARLSATGGRRLEETETLSVAIGGAESNVAVALARLGRQVAWLSALPRNPGGRRIAGELRRHGVDVQHVIWEDDPSARAGVYYIEPGQPPRPTRVLYDRAGSAVAQLDPQRVDAGVVRAARAIQMTGITPALSPSCAAICAALADAASAASVPLIFDVNYRARLWTPEQARAGLAPLLRQTTLLFCGAGDAATIWGLVGEPEHVARKLLDLSAAQLVVLTLAEAGALAVARGGGSWRQPAVPVTVVDPVGAGDAFAAGFLHCWLDTPSDVVGALRSGAALAALKITMPGDLALITAEELDEALALLDAPGHDIQR
jgi:2-dehydro-3-deoxygluconokinase